MRLSKMHLKTLREVPAEAEIPSHVLLLRAGMIRKLVSGVYGFMPLGWRSIRKIEDIIREEMDRSGGQEIHMSAVQPAELWEESGRWYAYGPELWRLKDRNGRDFCLGPTHEEIFTDVVRSDISSYRQLPVNLYQIQTKYRDEARPRFGLMRSREFIMKDSYSFDRDEAGLDESYDEMYRCYQRIFDRCGLNYRPVEADTGAIGGSNSHEFTALSEVGESEIAYCLSCDMAATTERASCVDAAAETAEMFPMMEVHTPDAKTIEEVAGFLGLPKEKTIKALLFVTYDNEGKENGHVAAFVRGDRELNLIKLINALGIPEHAIAFADENRMGEATGSVGGFTGPTGLHDCTLVVDSELPGLRNLCAGACKKDYHLINVNYGRDYKGHIVTDLKRIREGDPCPVCGAPVQIARGIEVGQVFKLGTKYSVSMGATFIVAIVEQHHDQDGILWPMAVAPYHAVVTVVKPDEADQMALGERIYSELLAAGVEALLDDRDERPGVKFKDADLIGIPIRITVGRGAPEEMVEFKRRDCPDKLDLKASDAVARTAAAVREGK